MEKEMIWKKEKLKPVQPYFVMDKEAYIQKMSANPDISHFYTFGEKIDSKSRIVPDGCIDLFFEYSDKGLKVHVCGTKIQFAEGKFFNESQIMGVRFMPGVLPPMIDAKIGDLTGGICDFEDISKGDISWIREMAQERDFAKQINIFEKVYDRFSKKDEVYCGREKIVKTTRELIYSTDGKIKISEIEDYTGYSERYINKVFSEDMGFSPKTFCKIIQFQRCLEYLDYGAPGKMTDASVKLGFYDQSQFIKDFKRYAGITPKRYLDMVESVDYKNLMRKATAW